MLVAKVLKLIQQLRNEVDGSRLALVAEHDIKSAQ